MMLLHCGRPPTMTRTVTSHMLLVCVALAGCVSSAVNADDRPKLPLRLEDIHNGLYEPNPQPGHNWFGGYLVFRNNDGDLVAYSSYENKLHTLMLGNFSGLETSYSQQYSLDHRFVMLEQKVHDVYKYSRKSKYYLYYLGDPDRRLAEPRFVCQVSQYKDLRLVDYATFAARAAIVFVQEGQVFHWQINHKTMGINKRELSREPNDVERSGSFDYGFETGLFHRSDAVWPSPSGIRIAYIHLQTDKSMPVRTFQRFRTVEQPEGFVALPVNVTVQYQMPSKPLPYMALRVFDVRSNRDQAGRNEFELHRPVDDDFDVISGVEWVKEDLLLVVWMNGDQSAMLVQLCDWRPKPASPTQTSRKSPLKPGRRERCQIILRYRVHLGWLLPQRIFYSDEDQRIAMIRSVPHINEKGVADLHEQVVLMEPNLTGDEATDRYIELNSFDFNAERIVGMETHPAQVIFYLGNELQRPQERQLYAVLYKFGARTEQCITCDGVWYGRDEARGPRYLHFDAHFTPNSRVFVLESQGPFVPRRDVFEWTLTNREGLITKRVRMLHRYTLQRNDALRERMEATVAMPRVLYRGAVLRYGHTVRVRLQVPPEYDGDSFNFGEVDSDRKLVTTSEVRPTTKIPSKRFPLLVVTASNGPGAFVGTAEWSVDWTTFMVLNKSTIVATIDGAGSSRRNTQIMYSVYGRLGDREIEDIGDMVGHLIDKWDYIDPRRVGVWGSTNYGAYIAGRALADTKGKARLRCAAMRAPIVDWQGFNKIFTERFMRKSSDPVNSMGYSQVDLLPRVQFWRGRSVLLVHPQRYELMEMDMTKRLIEEMDKEGVDHEHMVFPSMSDWQLHKRRSMGQRLSEFFHRCLVDYCYFPRGDTCAKCDGVE